MPGVSEHLEKWKTIEASHEWTATPVSKKAAVRRAWYRELEGYQEYQRQSKTNPSAYSERKVAFLNKDAPQIEAPPEPAPVPELRAYKGGDVPFPASPEKRETQPRQGAIEAVGRGAGKAAAATLGAVFGVPEAAIARTILPTPPPKEQDLGDVKYLPGLYKLRDKAKAEKSTDLPQIEAKIARVEAARDWRPTSPSEGERLKAAVGGVKDALSARSLEDLGKLGLTKGQSPMMDIAFGAAIPGLPAGKALGALARPAAKAAAKAADKILPAADKLYPEITKAPLPEITMAELAPRAAEIRGAEAATEKEAAGVMRLGKLPSGRTRADALLPQIASEMRQMEAIDKEIRVEKLALNRRLGNLEKEFNIKAEPTRIPRNVQYHMESLEQRLAENKQKAMTAAYTREQRLADERDIKKDIVLYAAERLGGGLFDQRSALALANRVAEAKTPAGLRATVEKVEAWRSARQLKLARKDALKKLDDLSQSPQVSVEYQQFAKGTKATLFPTGTPSPKPLSLKAGQNAEEMASQALSNTLRLGDMGTAELKALSERLDYLKEAGKSKLLSDTEKVDAVIRRIADNVVAGSVDIGRAPQQAIGLKPEGMLEKGKRYAASALRWADVGFSNVDEMFNGMDKVGDYTGPNYGMKRTIDAAAFRWLAKEDARKARFAEALSDRIFENSEVSRKIGLHAVLKEMPEEQVRAMGYTDEAIKAAKTLTPEENAVYQTGRKIFDELFEEVNNVRRTVENKPLFRRENYFTHYGAKTEDDIRGQALSSRLDPFVLPPSAGAAAQKEGIEVSGDVDRGFMKERVEERLKPIDIDFVGVVSRYMREATLYTEFAPELRILAGVINDPRWAAKVGEKNSEFAKTYMELLERLGGQAFDDKKNMAKSVLGWVRQNISAGTLAWNVTSAVIQLASAPNSVSLVGPRLFRDMMELSVNKGTRKWVLDNFPELRSRMGGDPTVMDRLSPPKQFLGTDGRLTRDGWNWLKALDTWTASATALSAYKNALETAGETFSMAGRANVDAVIEAQRIVRKAQAGTLFKDVPLVFTGDVGFGREVNRTLLQFQSFPIQAMWNRLRYDVIKYGKQNPGQAASTVAGILMSSLMEEQIRSGYRGMVRGALGKPPEERDFDMGQYLQRTAGNAVPFGNSMFMLNQTAGRFGDTPPLAAVGKSVAQALPGGPEGGGVTGMLALAKLLGMPVQEIERFYRESRKP